MVSSTTINKKSSKKTHESKKTFGLLPVHKILGPHVVGNQKIVPELFTEEQRRIYQSQVLIPISITGKAHAM